MLGKPYGLGALRELIESRAHFISSGMATEMRCMLSFYEMMGEMSLEGMGKYQYVQ